MSDSPDNPKLVEELTKLVAKELYHDLGHPVAARMGEVLGEALDIMFLPVHMLSLPARKAHLLLKQNLRDFALRIAQIPSSQIRRPPNEIAVPVLHRLSYATDDDIRKLYIELLAKASDANRENAAHPSFISTIDRMSPDEAKILPFLNGKDAFPFIWVRMVFIETPKDSKFPEGVHGIDLTPDLTGIEFRYDLRFKDNMPLYLTNLESLGFVSRDSTHKLSDVDVHYAPLETRYEDVRKKLFDLGHKGKQYPVIFHRGYYRVTPFATSFLSAVTIDSGG